MKKESKDKLIDNTHNTSKIDKIDKKKNKKPIK